MCQPAISNILNKRYNLTVQITLKNDNVSLLVIALLIVSEQNKKKIEIINFELKHLLLLEQSL